MLSTKKFITIVSVALFVFVLIVGSIAFATAESNDVYEVDAVVVSWETTPWGDLEIEVVDEEGNVWGYFADADEDVHIGDVVTLTLFHYGDEEDDEIIDVVRVDHLDTLEMVQWLCR